MNIPDYVSPIVAHRVWRWDRSGLASLRGESWPTGHALTAQCPGNHIDAHQAPQESCTCGIYAARSLDQAREMGYAAWAIYGEVYLWGVVVEHKLGWRAQFAYPKNLVVPFHMIPIDEKKAQSRLEALVAYGVDILIDDGKEQRPLWKKGSGYEPAGMDYMRKVVSVGSASGKKSILLIEDQPVLQSLLALRLRREGYVVETANDGIEGFEKAMTSPFDLIILCVMLPYKSGFDVCRDIRQAGLATPILFLTARNHIADKVLALKLGADDYVTKPFNTAELLARIEALLRRGPVHHAPTNKSREQ